MSYKEFSSFKSFITQFNKAIPSYDETKYYFKNKPKLYQGTYLCFVCDGKLYKIHMYCSTHSIELWKRHIEEFCVTGKFDFNCYFVIYNSKNVSGKYESTDIGDTLKFPVKIEKGEISNHSVEMGEYLTNYRRNVDNSVGIRHIPKPENFN